VPRVYWKGTGSRYIEVPGVGPRGLVILEPGFNRISHEELAAMQVAAKIDLDAGTIAVMPEVPPVVAPGMVDTATEEEIPATAAPPEETPAAPAEASQQDQIPPAEAQETPAAEPSGSEPSGTT
jgi:hypothetical protein